MKNGAIIKSAAIAEDEDVKLINNYTRREMKADELYTFSLVLCDNEIDRDFERFSIPALYTLADLYVGKTGVFDHDAKTENQIARIYKCFVERDEGKKTQAGEDYHRLVAKAYLPITDGNKELITLLDSGIRKEVSVGCAIGKSTCSVCGADLRKQECKHQKGKSYGSKLCHAVLSDPVDAYEWSFVAIPAQRKAGVIKSFKSSDKGVIGLTDTVKMLAYGRETVLSQEQSAELYSYINELEHDAKIGKAYKDEMRNEVVRLSAIIFPEISGEVMSKLADNMDYETLKAFKAAYGANVNKKTNAVPSLWAGDANSNNKNNRQLAAFQA